MVVFLLIQAIIVRIFIQLEVSFRNAKEPQGSFGIQLLTVLYRNRKDILLYYKDGKTMTDWYPTQ